MCVVLIHTRRPHRDAVRARFLLDLRRELVFAETGVSAVPSAFNSAELDSVSGGVGVGAINVRGKVDRVGYR